MNQPAFTIARAAEAAAVGVETIRYYERRGLVPQPAQASGGYRRYEHSHVARIRFIKRAQELGFSLQDIEGLLALEDGTDRAEVRRIASARLAEIRSRLEDLQRMQRTLAALLDRCRHGGAAKCPIIEAISAAAGPSAARASEKRTGALSAASPRRKKAGAQAAALPAGRKRRSR